MDSVMHGRHARAGKGGRGRHLHSLYSYYAQKSDSKPVELGCFLSPVERGKGAREHRAREVVIRNRSLEGRTLPSVSADTEPI